ncbi:tRNA (uracil-5-)-methyltransferase homolog A [Sitodiplosis mosellana]|uniref:tRNA (uracil-5-)-methyltransferase homolog A n=1 Tax=Sitodiplosis mosellana TaxID=263140 RepID=UPI002445323A|nr:tRNA (uracil-5-)-methyltransferase homolog A [Sitodiplosis mosellana]
MESTSVEQLPNDVKNETSDNVQIDKTDENPQQQRQDFNSEYNKIELGNLGKFAFGELRALIKKLKLKPTKIKTTNSYGGRDFAFLCFRTVEEKESAMKLFNGYKWKGKEISAKEGKAVLDPLIKRRLAEESLDQNAPKPKKFRKKTVVEATVPLANVPYENQLIRKEKECMKHLQAYATSVKKASLELRPMIQANEKEKGLPCIWHGIKQAPKINGYRNKCEFAVGLNANNERTVGFRLGSYTDGSLEVASIQDLPHIPDRTKLAVQLYESYIKQSKYDVFNMQVYKGQFRQFTVRLSESTGEIMIVAGIHTTEILDELDDLLKDIVDFFTERNGKELNVSSIYLEEINKREIGQVQNNFRHVHGSKYITDTILGLKFRISAASFFQINTQSAEVLYELAIKMGKIDSGTTILDICCGTGTIGLCFAKHCKEVLGVEIIADAINDAKFNAQENGIENSKFYAGNCDDYIHSLVYEAENENLLAIIDPPRAGIQTKSKEALRNARGLNRFIYIACAPKAAMQNWIDFSRPCSKTLKGEPFVLKEAAAVDMFPHTEHIEMVLLFERLVRVQKAKEKENGNETQTSAASST